MVDHGERCDFFFLFKTKLIFVLGGALWVTANALWVKFFPPEGLRIKASAVPTLFNEISALTTRIGSKPIDEVVITGDFNAAMAQTPRLGIFGWHKNTLVLGMQLLMTLSPEQARAVIAHELGHYSQKHSAFAARIYRAREAWAKIAYAMGDKKTWGGGIFRKAVHWYVNRFDALSFPLARSNEFEADRLAHDTTSGAIGYALVHTAVDAPWLSEKYWSPLLSVKALAVSVPDQPFHAMRTFLQNNRPDSLEISKYLEQAQQRKTEAWDTHPSLNARLENLGVAAQYVPLAGTNAAEAWFNDRLGDTLTWLDDRWKERNVNAIDHAVKQFEASKAHYAELCEKPVESLSLDDALAHASLTEDLVNDEDGLRAYEAVLAREPDSPAAQFNVARMRYKLERASEAVPMLEALSKRIPFSPNACAMLAAHYQKATDVALAEKWQKAAEEQSDRWHRLLERRSTINSKDTIDALSKPYTELREDIAERLRNETNVKWIALAQRNDLDWPEEPQLVVAVGLPVFTNADTSLAAFLTALENTNVAFVVVDKGDFSALAARVRQVGVEIEKLPKRS